MGDSLAFRLEKLRGRNCRLALELSRQRSLSVLVPGQTPITPMCFALGAVAKFASRSCVDASMGWLVRWYIPTRNLAMSDWPMSADVDRVSCHVGFGPSADLIRSPHQ